MGRELLIVLYILLPLLSIYLSSKFYFFRRVGTVVICYAFGLVLGPLGAGDEVFSKLQDTIMNIAVPLAIPLMLFSSDVRAWRHLALKPLYSLVFALIGVLISVVLGYYLFGSFNVPDFHKISGMLVGTYSGGTPNLASLKLMLNVKEEVYLAIHSYDMAIGAVYLFVLMGVGQRLFQLVLPAYGNHDSSIANASEVLNPSELVKDRSLLIRLLGVFGVALLLVVISGGVMLLFPESLQMIVFIFMITTLGIIGSSVKKIQSTKGTFDLGMYFILVFSVVVASKVSVSHFTNLNPAIFGYITFVVFVSLTLHVLLAKIKNVDSDTVIVTSAALLCSPPFVPVVAGAIGNRDVIAPGITVGLIGYAIGNYLGLAVSTFMQWL